MELACFSLQVLPSGTLVRFSYYFISTISAFRVTLNPALLKHFEKKKTSLLTCMQPLKLCLRMTLYKSTKLYVIRDNSLVKSQTCCNCTTAVNLSSINVHHIKIEHTIRLLETIFCSLDSFFFSCLIFISFYIGLHMLNWKSCKLAISSLSENIFKLKNK